MMFGHTFVGAPSQASPGWLGGTPSVGSVGYSGAPNHNGIDPLCSIFGMGLIQVFSLLAQSFFNHLPALTLVVTLVSLYFLFFCSIKVQYTFKGHMYIWKKCGKKCVMCSECHHLLHWAQ